ncbi:response regulator [Bacilliculturomica massiliensis]|uniref:response regulator n=1 Tax=Bacilliculturomica massiliensis TaxID=1917867 RepID=UPI001031FAF8|nr:response regulator [Bacilliculturomica massiliensis]
MKTILVDDEMLSLEHFKYQCEDIDAVEIVGCFEFPLDALAYAQEHRIDCAVLDITMPEMDGLELGRRLKQIHPDLVLVYVTGYGEFAQEAMALRAATYLMKPYSKDDVVFAMHRARLLCRGGEPRLKVKTFGRFDVFCGNQPITFRNAKARELFALCVDHNGGTVTMEEAVDKLWEDRPFNEQTKALYRKAVMSLRKQLEEAEASDVFVTGRGVCHILPEKLSCDYFDLLAGSVEMRAAYMGEFMAEYSWAENTAANLTRLVRRRMRPDF